MQNWEYVCTNTTFIQKNIAVFDYAYPLENGIALFGALQCSDFYHPNDEGGLKFDDPAIGVEWPIPEGMELIMSDKDKAWSGIEEYKEKYL